MQAWVAWAEFRMQTLKRFLTEIYLTSFLSSLFENWSSIAAIVAFPCVCVCVCARARASAPPNPIKSVKTDQGGGALSLEHFAGDDVLGPIREDGYRQRSRVGLCYRKRNRTSMEALP